MWHSRSYGRHRRYGYDFFYSERTKIPRNEKRVCESLFAVWLIDNLCYRFSLSHFIISIWHEHEQNRPVAIENGKNTVPNGSSNEKFMRKALFSHALGQFYFFFLPNGKLLRAHLPWWGRATKKSKPTGPNGPNTHFSCFFLFLVHEAKITDIMKFTSYYQSI